MPTAMPAAARLYPEASVKIDWMIAGLMTVSAKNPSTTLGMPARISRIGLIVRRTLGVAYSER